MAEQDRHFFECPGCQREYGWQARLAGRRVTCKCGHVFQVPPEMPEDEYALADEPAAGAKPVVPVASVTPAAPVVRPAAVLNYRSAPPADEQRKRMFDDFGVKDVWLPACLIVAGLCCRLLLHPARQADGNLRAAAIMGLIAMGTIYNVLLMLVGIKVAARMVDIEFAAPLPTLVKLGFTFVIAASIGGAAGSLDGFDTAGIGVGISAMVVIYWIMIGLLFKSGAMDTMWTVAIMMAIQGIANVGIWRV